MRTSTQPYNPASRSFEPEQSAPIITVPPRGVQPDPTEGTNVSSHEVAVVSLGLMLLVSVWYFIRRDLRQRKASDGSDQNSQHSLTRADRLTNHLPCTKCHYFKANMYLPCAVNPTAVLKPDAMNCSDFRSRNGSEYTEATG